MLTQKTKHVKANVLYNDAANAALTAKLLAQKAVLQTNESELCMLHTALFLYTQKFAANKNLCKQANELANKIYSNITHVVAR